MLGVLDIMEVEVQDREQVEVGEKVEARETEEEDKNKETTNAQTCDDMWMNIFLCRHAVRHLELQCDVCTRMKVSRKSLM